MSTRLKVQKMGESAEGIRLAGNPRNPEPHHTRIVFPGGFVEVTRVGERDANCDYWVHIGVGKPGCGMFTPGEDEEGWITDARLDQTDKHSADADTGDFNRPQLYHVAMRVTRTMPKGKKQ